MKRLSLSAFLTITPLYRLRVLYLILRHNKGHLRRNLPHRRHLQTRHLRHSRGRASRSWPPVDRRDLCKAARRQALGCR